MNPMQGQGWAESIQGLDSVYQSQLLAASFYFGDATPFTLSTTFSMPSLIAPLA
jgi:hypothetical protein